MSVSPADETRKISVLLVGESPHLFSFLRPPLEKIGCQCHLAKSHQEVGKILSHTKLDIVLSLTTHQSLSEMTAVLAGSRITMFHMLPVEEGCLFFEMASEPDIRYRFLILADRGIKRAGVQSLSYGAALQGGQEIL